jgi:quercetin dioxygenase-like cupin family protein
MELPDGKTVAVLAFVEVQPNLVSPRHLHPGVEVGYVLEGSIEFTIGEQPPKTFDKGDSFSIPLNSPHVAKAGPNGAKLLNTFMVEKDKPLVIPSP